MRERSCRIDSGFSGATRVVEPARCHPPSARILGEPSPVRRGPVEAPMPRVSTARRPSGYVIGVRGTQQRRSTATTHGCSRGRPAVERNAGARVHDPAELELNAAARLSFGAAPETRPTPLVSQRWLDAGKRQRAGVAFAVDRAAAQSVAVGGDKGQPARLEPRGRRTGHPPTKAPGLTLPCTPVRWAAAACEVGSRQGRSNKSPLLVSPTTTVVRATSGKTVGNGPRRCDG